MNIRRDINKYLSVSKDEAAKMMAEDHLKNLMWINKKFASKRNGADNFNLDDIRGKFIEKIRSRLTGN